MKSHDQLNADYHLKFGLQRDPFPPMADDVLYKTAAFNEQLQRIKETIAGSQKVILVSAAAGAGKSTLADYLEARPEENWRINLIQAESDMSKEALAHRLIQEALPEKADKPAMAIPMLHKYLELSSHAGFIPVFIIDDVDKLSTDTLKFVLELATLRYAESLYHIVLFADESLVSRLEDPVLNELASGIVHTLQLPPLSPQQMREYIDIRLKAAGEDGSYPFDDEKLEHIYNISGGLPGRINLAARKAMQVVTNDTAEETVAPEPATTRQHGNFGKIAAAVVIAIASGLAFYFYPFGQPTPKNTNNIATVEPVDVIPDSIPEPLDTPAPAAESVVEPLQNTATDELVTTGSVEPPADESASLQTPATDIAPSNVAVPAAVPEVPAPNIVTEPVTTPVPVETSTATVRSYTIDEANIYNLDPVPAILAGIRGNSWYRSQSRTAYTLQLISASDINNVTELLEDAPDTKAELSGYVKYTPSGKPRYLMFYGLYTDKDSANAAIASLPATLQAVNPWPRSIGNITDEIDTVIAPPR